MWRWKQSCHFVVALVSSEGSSFHYTPLPIHSNFLSFHSAQHHTIKQFALNFHFIINATQAKNQQNCIGYHVSEPGYVPKHPGSHDDHDAVDEAWAHPVFRDQSVSGIRPIRPRVKHKKQPHYIRITSVSCCIRPHVKHKKETDYLQLTSCAILYRATCQA